MRVQNPDATPDAGDRKSGARRGLLSSFQGFFDRGERSRGKHNEGNPRGPGVVLLIGREREEEQRKGGIDTEQPYGTAAKLEAEDVAGYVCAGGVVEVEID